MSIETIWSEYRSNLKAFLQSRVANSADVEDLLQEILIKTHNNLPQLKSEQKIKPWLFQIANNAIIDFYRKSGRTQEPQAEDLWYQQSKDDVRESLARCIAPFIQSLPSDASELLTAIDLNGLAQKDYAEQQGIPYSTLKSRLKKGRSQLRERFAACCHFSLDKHGNIIDYEQKSGDCKGC